jgi:hypothetical protein
MEDLREGLDNYALELQWLEYRSIATKCPEDDELETEVVFWRGRRRWVPKSRQNKADYGC